MLKHEAMDELIKVRVNRPLRRAYEVLAVRRFLRPSHLYRDALRSYPPARKLLARRGKV